MKNNRNTVPEEILSREIDNILKKYKIQADMAREILIKNFESAPSLVKRMIERCTLEDVTRWKEYQDIVKKTKKQIYYLLRQYKTNQTMLELYMNQLQEKIRNSPDKDEIHSLVFKMLELHTSTQERLPYYNEFYKIFFQLVGDPVHILDLGCGLHPLTYPFEKVKNLKSYVAIDNDKTCIDALTIYSRYNTAKNKLIPLKTDITSTNLLKKIQHKMSSKYDVTLLLKLIPVLYRRNHESIDNLVSIPSKFVFITANAESMTKYEKIYHRENSILKLYMKNSGRSIKSEFRLGTEFGYLLE